MDHEVGGHISLELISLTCIILLTALACIAHTFMPQPPFVLYNS